MSIHKKVTKQQQELQEKKTKCRKEQNTKTLVNKSVLEQQQMFPLQYPENGTGPQNIHTYTFTH